MFFCSLRTSCYVEVSPKLSCLANGGKISYEPGIYGGVTILFSEYVSLSYGIELSSDGFGFNAPLVFHFPK